MFIYLFVREWNDRKIIINLSQSILILTFPGFIYNQRLLLKVLHQKLFYLPTLTSRLVSKTPIGLKIHQKSVQNYKKNHLYFKISFHEGNFLALVQLCVSIILVQIMIRSHFFYVDEADNRTLRTPISLKMHQKSVQNKKKITFASSFVTEKEQLRQHQ